MTLSDELEKMWKESVVAYFNLLFQRLFGGTEENAQNSHLRYQTQPCEVESLLRSR